MKRIVLIIMTLMLALVFTGCAKEDEDSSLVTSAVAAGSALPQPSVNCNGEPCID